MSVDSNTLNNRRQIIVQYNNILIGGRDGYTDSDHLETFRYAFQIQTP